MRKLRWIAAGGLLVLIGAGVFAYWFDLLSLPEVEDGDYPMRPVSALVESDRLDLGGWLSVNQFGGTLRRTRMWYGSRATPNGRLFPTRR